MGDELPHSDEEIELRELLRQAMAGPDHPLTAAQIVRILAPSRRGHRTECSGRCCPPRPA
jgi:hypothetical protein